MSGVDEFLRNVYIITETTGGPPLTWGHSMKGPPPKTIRTEHGHKKHKNTETSSPYIPWNNSQLDKDQKLDQGIEHGTLWSVDNDIQMGQAVGRNLKYKT